MFIGTFQPITAIEIKNQIINLIRQIPIEDLKKLSKFYKTSVDYILDLIKVKADGQNRTDF